MNRTNLGNAADPAVLESLAKQGTPFGTLLERERVERGWSIARVARLAGVKEKTYRGWEANEILPSKVELRRIFGCGCSIQHLLPKIELAPAPEQQAPAPPPTPAPAPAPEPSVTAPEPPTEAKAPKPMLDPPTTFGEALRREREAIPFTVDELAVVLDVSISTVSYWENNTFAPIGEHYRMLVEHMPKLANAPKPSSQEMAKPGPKPGQVARAPETSAPSPAPPPSAMPNLIDPLSALDRLVMAFDTLGQSVELAPFGREADGAWHLALHLRGDEAPLVVGRGPSMSAAALSALGGLRATVLERHAQTKRIVETATARLHAHTQALAAIDGAISGR